MLGISGRYCSACQLLTCTEPRDLRPIWSLPIEPGRGSHGLELPDDAVKSVDAIVAKSDGAHFLLATVYLRPECDAGTASRREAHVPKADTSAASRQITGRSGTTACQYCSTSNQREGMGLFRPSLAKDSEWNCPILTSPTVPLKPV